LSVLLSKAVTSFGLRAERRRFEEGVKTPLQGAASTRQTTNPFASTALVCRAVATQLIPLPATFQAIARAKWGREGFYRIVAGSDPAVATAAQQFDRSSTILTAAKEPDWRASRRDARTTRVAIPRLPLERDATAGAVAGSRREPATALRAELRTGLGTGTVGRARGRNRGGGRRDGGSPLDCRSGLPRRALRAQGSHCLAGVLELESGVVGVRQLSRRAVEFDFPQGPQRDGAGRQIVVRILSFVARCSA
jgi:hypothetical protein